MNYTSNSPFNGRNGADELSVTLIVTAVLLLIACPIFTSGYLSYILIALALFLLALALWRSFSRNVAKRREENWNFVRFFRGKTEEEKKAERERRQKRKENEKIYAYFTCPRCRKELRVPRGKGKIRIKCPGCSNEFIRRT